MRRRKEAALKEGGGATLGPDGDFGLEAGAMANAKKWGRNAFGRQDTGRDGKKKTLKEKIYDE